MILIVRRRCKRACAGCRRSSACRSSNFVVAKFALEVAHITNFANTPCDGSGSSWHLSRRLVWHALIYVGVNVLVTRPCNTHESTPGVPGAVQATSQRQCCRQCSDVGGCIATPIDCTTSCWSLQGSTTHSCARRAASASWAVSRIISIAGWVHRATWYCEADSSSSHSVCPLRDEPRSAIRRAAVSEAGARALDSRHVLAQLLNWLIHATVRTVRRRRVWRRHKCAVACLTICRCTR